MSPWPQEECWCPSRLCQGVHAVLMAVLGWQGCECLTVAETELYSRYPVPHQISKLGKLVTTSVPEQMWGQPMVQKANLPLAGHPFSLLWIQISTAPLAPALYEGLPHNYSEAKSSEGRNHHATHKQAKHRAGEGTGLKTPRGAVAGRSSTLLLCSRGRSLLRAERDPGTGSDVCAGSEAKAGLVSPSAGREGGRPVSSRPRSEPVLHMQAWAGSWAANRHSWGTAGFRQGVPGRSERAGRSPGEN